MSVKTQKANMTKLDWVIISSSIAFYEGERVL